MNLVLYMTQDVIQLRVLRWGKYPGLPNGPNTITQIPKIRDSGLWSEGDGSVVRETQHGWLWRAGQGVISHSKQAASRGWER